MCGGEIGDMGKDFTLGGLSHWLCLSVNFFS